MASGGIFNIITNTSNADRLIFAQDFLTKRINTIIKQRDPGITDEVLVQLPQNDKYININNTALPSLIEIEKSHTTFINGAYKPCIPLASQYIKVGSNAPNFGSTITYQMPSIGNFITDSVLHIHLTGMSAIDLRDRVRYVAMLAHRLIKKVTLLANNGSVIDEYGTDEYNVYYQTELKSTKRLGYLKGIGQQIPHIGNLVADPLVDQFSQSCLILDGLQTFKSNHGEVDLFIPLLFWFKNIKNALPCLQWGSLQVRVELANLVDIVSTLDNGGGGGYNPPLISFVDLYVNQLFTTPEIFSIFQKKYVFNIIRLHKSQKRAIVNNEKILLNELKFPIEYINIMFRPRINLTLSQEWYKNTVLTPMSYQVPVVAKNPLNVIDTSTISSTVNTVTLTTSNGTFSTIIDFYNNYRLNILSGSGYNTFNTQENTFKVIAYDGVNTFTVDRPWPKQPDTTTQFELFTQVVAINSVTYYKESPVVKTIALNAHGIEIYSEMIERFYNNYLINSFDNFSNPFDMGIYLMSFCRDPLKNNPSGSLDFSITRECYLEFKSDAISSDYPVDVLILGKAINFILMDKGGITLKYST
jgi:hypothetical protein